MFNKRQAEARQVADALLPAAIDLENAIVHAAQLAITVVEERRSAKLPGPIGQHALALVFAAGTRMVEARGDLVTAVNILSGTPEARESRARFSDISEHEDDDLAPIINFPKDD